MNAIKRTGVVLGVLLFGTVVLASSRTVPQMPECVTTEQVVQHMDNSRNGISLTCNEEIRQRNVQRAGATQH